MGEPLETNHASLGEPTGFGQYYYKSRERLLQQQRERRDALKDTPEFKQRRSVYNQRYREKSGAAAYMRDYYHRSKERISEMRKRHYHRVDDEVKEQRRQRRRERLQVKPEGLDMPRSLRGRPKSSLRFGTNTKELESSTVLRGMAQLHVPLDSQLCITVTRQ